ncbi:hypothetical protein [Candidatus Chloroploca asiatica]|uniref:Glycosyltransferase RgtA/B/C/D-like domain-containing protein n=1 Tax=Candidatus Chloroploca asiatica TaxID=1506545 RepID=A0A2H3L1B7_9CHLR|nr:hypothetical protein [Candidatus Chloroploca asiatica]PDV98454.1 hypothetical protein A9Q02_15235 [Candidatus Chloroploca asiatica]
MTFQTASEREGILRSDAPRGRDALIARVAEISRWILAWRLWLLVILAMIGLFAIYQRPLDYAFQMGIDQGIGTDHPFLEGFLDAEGIPGEQTWRWTRPSATVTVPGVGQQPLMVALTIVSHQQNWLETPEQPLLRIDLGTGAPLLLALRQHASTYHIYVPPAALQDGTLHLGLSADPWQHPTDVRGYLGVAVGNAFALTSLADQALVWPGRSLMAGYALTIVLGWAALGLMGFAQRTAGWLLLGLVATLLVLVGLVPPRMGAMHPWMAQAAGIALLSAAAARLVVPPLLRRFAVAPRATIMRWLLLVLVLTVVAKYAGRLHPAAMPGDIQFHANRFIEALTGNLTLVMRHRGLVAPYPGGWYLLIAPLSLTGLPLDTLLWGTAALAELAAILIFFVLLTRLTGTTYGGLIGAVIYALSPIPMQNIWWSFQAQIGAQMLSILVMALLVLTWPAYDQWGMHGQPTRLPGLGWLPVLLTLVFLGHIGSFINVSAVVVAAAALLWLQARTGEERAGARHLLVAWIMAFSFVMIFFYSRYSDLILGHAASFTEGGMANVTDREPLSRQAWLGSLWQDGILTLNGFFLVPLGLAGALILTLNPHRRRGSLLILLWLTFGLGLSQAILPLITLSTITTRWVTFAGWALTVGATFAVIHYRRRGWAGKLVTGTVLAYLAWRTLEVWILAMAFNRPPLEPF